MNKKEILCYNCNHEIELMASGEYLHSNFKTYEDMEGNQNIDWDLCTDMQDIAIPCYYNCRCNNPEVKS